MLSSVLATFDKSRYLHVRTVLLELKHDEKLNIKGIVYGQLFEKMTASIFVQEVELQPIFEKLMSNDIHIFAYNEEYKQKLIDTYNKLKAANAFVKDRVRTYYSNTNTFARSGKRKKEDAVQELISTKNVSASEKRKNLTNKEEIKPNFEFLNKQETSNFALIDRLCKAGDYIAIGNIVKRNPVMNGYAKENYIPAIKNCIKINLDKGLENWNYVDTAITRLKDIACNAEIKAITSEDLINEASNALIEVCTANDPTKLIYLANLAAMGQKINVMAFIKLSELIFENEKTNNKIDKILLKKVVAQINTTFILISYDVMETVLAEENKNRFNKLIDTIIEVKTGTSTLL